MLRTGRARWATALRRLPRDEQPLPRRDHRPDGAPVRLLLPLPLDALEGPQRALLALGEPLVDRAAELHLARRHGGRVRQGSLSPPESALRSPSSIPSPVGWCFVVVTPRPSSARARPKMFFREHGVMPASVELKLAVPRGVAGCVGGSSATTVAVAERATRDAQLAKGITILGRKAVRAGSAFDSPKTSAPRRDLRPLGPVGTSGIAALKGLRQFRQYVRALRHVFGSQPRSGSRRSGSIVQAGAGGADVVEPAPQNETLGGALINFVCSVPFVNVTSKICPPLSKP